MLLHDTAYGATWYKTTELAFLSGKWYKVRGKGELENRRASSTQYIKTPSEHECHKHNSYTGICLFIILKTLALEKSKEKSRAFFVEIPDTVGICDSSADVERPSTTHCACLCKRATLYATKSSMGIQTRAKWTFQLQGRILSIEYKSDFLKDCFDL